jgi:2-polyprenyl-6-hydroxyphenyl methylase/3-demethylubiquinone-9 3-methyltransferase
VASIDAAKLHAAEQKNPLLASIRYIVGSATELPFESGTFDAAVCVDVLEHIPRWPLALAELRRVLRPGGWLFFDTINRNPLSAFVFVPLLERTLGWIAPGTHDPKMFIKPPEMRLALEGMGFQNIHMTGFHVGLSLTKRQVTSFAGGPTSLMYIGRAQRT